MLGETLQQLLGCTRAMQIWVHAAHNCTKGTGFMGDHADLYGEIYEALGGEYDAFAERAIGLTNNEDLACPHAVTRIAMEHMSGFPSPCNATALTIAATALAFAQHHLQTLTNTYESLKASGEITLGLDDLLMATCSVHETNVYLLQQRVKAHLDG